MIAEGELIWSGLGPVYELKASIIEPGVRRNRLQNRNRFLTFARNRSETTRGASLDLWDAGKWAGNPWKLRKQFFPEFWLDRPGHFWTFLDRFKRNIAHYERALL